MFKKTLETAKYTVKLSVPGLFYPFLPGKTPTARGDSSFRTNISAIPRALPEGRRSTCPPVYKNGDFRAA